MAPDHWGRGYATEIAHTAVRYGFATLKLEHLVSFARPENTASIRVLEKVGMRFAEFLPEMNRNHYVMTRSDIRGHGSRSPR